MGKEPKVYIALENDTGQLVVDGPLSLLDQLVKALTTQKAQSKAELAAEPAQEDRHDSEE